MYVIGLTGNFGTGKTTVSKILTDLGAIVINADEIGHEVLKDQQVKNEMISAFGDAILAKNGEVDRRYLGEIAFKDKDSARRLNTIMHPEIRSRILEKIKNYQAQNKKIVVLEAAVMPRNDWVNIIDEQWVTTAPTDEIINRLRRDRGYSQSEVLSRLHSQMSQSDMSKEADLLIDTSSSIEALKQQVKDIWKSLMNRVNNKTG